MDRDNSYLHLIEIAPAQCALAAGFDRDTWIPAIFALVAVYWVVWLLVIQGIDEYLPDRKQIEDKIHGDGFLHLAAMTCTLQDSIAAGLRAA
jgi:hypothetical protein